MVCCLLLNCILPFPIVDPNIREKSVSDFFFFIASRLKSLTNKPSFLILFIYFLSNTIYLLMRELKNLKKKEKKNPVEAKKDAFFLYCRELLIILFISYLCQMCFSTSLSHFIADISAGEELQLLLKCHESLRVSKGNTCTNTSSTLDRLQQSI